MKYLILPLMGFLLTMTMCSNVRAEYFLAGDSISCWPGSYVDRLDLTIRNNCQPGRSIQSYDIPRDLHASDLYFTKALYVLGANDILGRMHIPLSERQFIQHMEQLRLKYFQVIVIAPPIFDRQPEWSRKMRAVIWRQKKLRGYRIIDLNQIWPSVTTMDGIHPDEHGHQTIADWLRRKLGGEKDELPNTEG